jgi:Vitamin B12 dependent methionine synthase, activation domain/Homocysteine S-methyltransferase
MTFDTRPPGAADQAPSALRTADGERLLIADGAMGSMLQGCPVTLEDFPGLEGCNEILNVTRPDIVRSIHDGYLDAGVDCITTNTFGPNLGNLGEYGIADRIGELSEAAELVETEGRPRLRMWLDRIQTEGLMDAGDDPAGLDEILKVRYRGCRYAFGYPACPDLEDRAKVMRLLEAGRIGVTLSEEFQLAPEQSTDARITHHPEASYFST